METNMRRSGKQLDHSHEDDGVASHDADELAFGSVPEQHGARPSNHVDHQLTTKITKITKITKNLKTKTMF